MADAHRAMVKVDGLAALQVVSGLFNLIVMTWTTGLVLALVSSGIGLLVTACGCPLGPLASLCGMWSLALIPLGVFEIVTGTLALLRRPEWAWLAPYTALAELMGFAFGGLGSFVVGLVALRFLRDADVQPLLEDFGDAPQVP